MMNENKPFPSTVTRNFIANRAVLWVLLIVCILVLIYISPTLTKPQYYSTDDFFPYWAAGRLNLNGENPYDAQKKDALQVEVSGQSSTTYPISIMLNPPYAVAIVMPFGLLDHPLSRMVWLIVNIASIVVCAQLYWRFYHGPPGKRWVAWIVLLIFGPMISVLEVGQISALLLLGITLFIYFTNYRHNDWAAGASLVLVAIKPQVTLIFWLAVVLWIIQNRRWKILASAVLAALLLTIVAMAFNPRIIMQYLTMVQVGYLPELATPTIGAYLRFFWLGTDKFWLQFIAPLIGAIWFLFYWRNHNHSWVWLEELPILLLVSQLTAPYTYTYDQVILIPVVIQSFIWLLRAWKKWQTLALVLTYLLINILDLLLHMRLSDFWFIWMAPALLVWYLLIRLQNSDTRRIASLAGA